MRISFNTQVTLGNDELIQLIAVMHIQDIKVTKKSLKEFIETSIKTTGINFIHYSMYDDYTNGPLSYPQKMAAWAVATNMVKGGIAIPQQEVETA